jgi:hypothetical protein
MTSGIYPRTEEHKKKISMTLKDKHVSPQTEFKKGRVPWNKDKRDKYTLTEETRRKQSLAKSGNNNPMKRLGVRQKQSETLKRLYREGKLISYNKGKKRSKESNKKNSEASKKLWQNPIYREKVIKATLKSLMKRPTSLEQRMIELIQKHNLPYKYVGDGEVIIGFRNPDFVNCNGEKMCLEVRPKIMCPIWNKCSPEEYERKQKEHYAKYGWRCIVIWFEENSEDILKKIQEVKKDG